MKKAIWYVLFIVFLMINFGGLALGIYLMDNGPKSIWYDTLEKAPWSPPNWLFGVAWSLIMICFSIYMTKLIQRNRRSYIWLLFCVQWILNVSWNYIFFNKHEIVFGAIVLVLLGIIILSKIILFHKTQRKYTLLLIPYFIWMLIAISLNVYVI